MEYPVNCGGDSASRLDFCPELGEYRCPMEHQQIYTELNRLLSEARIRRLYQKVEQTFNDRSSGTHDWEHVRRVIVNSIPVGLEEHADMNIVMPAVILHDLGHATNPEEPTLHATHGARECYRFLDEWSPDDRDLIAECVRRHKAKWPGFASTEPESLEERVVCDADQIDKFGWVGFLQVIRVYVEMGIIGMEHYKTLAGLGDAISHQGSITFYTEAGKRRAAELADPDFSDIAEKFAEELRLYEEWKEEF